jgi:iron(III) transport system permease protein
MWSWRSSRTIVLGVAAGVFVITCVLPVVSVLRTAVIEPAEPLTLTSRQWGLLTNTTLLGVGTALLATVLGVPLGFALARGTLLGTSALRIVLAAPIVLPPYLVALSWTYLTASQGLLASLVETDQLSAWTYSLPAAVVVLALVLYPVVMLATEVALRRVDGRWEEAALLVCEPRQVVRHITLPLVGPSIVAGALIVFVLAIAEFGAPAVLRVRVYTTDIFTAFAALYDPARAARTALPLLLLSGAVAAAAIALLRERLSSARRATPTPPSLVASRPRRILIAVLLVAGVALVVPCAVLALQATQSRSFAAALAGSGRAIANSVWVSAVSASVVVVIAIWLGYARARSPAVLGAVLDVLFVVLFAVPSTLVGVGLIGIWNRDGPMGAAYGTQAILVLANLARLLPLAAVVVAAVVRTVPHSHEEAGAVSGAGWLRSAWQLVLLQCRRGLMGTWVLVFVFAFGELGASILVAPPGESTLPIRIYTIIANTPASTVAALALLQAAVILTPVALIGGWLARREAR